MRNCQIKSWLIHFMRSCHIHVDIEQYKDIFFAHFPAAMALFLSLSTGLNEDPIEIISAGSHCGATRNRNLTISGWISLMYLLAKEVISRYCSTRFLPYFAVSCGVDFLLLYKGNALFWNTSRCLVFLLHLGWDSNRFIFYSNYQAYQ